MKQDAATKAVYQRWMNLWPGLSGSIPFVFDNDVIDETTQFARVSITMLDDHQHTLGAAPNRKFLMSGLIDIKLYGAGNAGRGPLDTMVDFVRQIFQTVRFGAAGTEEGIITYATTVTELRPKSDVEYWILVATTPFEFFDVR